MYHLISVSLSFLFLFLYGCVQNQSTPITRSGTADEVLNVGVSTNSPPLVYKKNMAVTGLEAELAQGLGRYMGKKIQFIAVKWDEQIPALKNRKTDIIMSGMTVTAARGYQVAFTRPYIFTGQISLVRREAYNKFSNGLSDLLTPGVRIGTVKATTGDYLIAQNKARGERTIFATSQQGVQALIEEKIDAFVYDMPGNLHYGAIYADKGLVPVLVPMTREQIAWAVRKDDPDTLAEANKYLESIKQSGELQQLVEKWIPYYKNLYNQ